MAYKSAPWQSKAFVNVALPDQIKCVRCKKFKIPSAFANNRLNDLRAKKVKDGRFDASTTAFIACLVCTQGSNGPVVELQCATCDKVKGKDAFSKAQRRNPDKAQCWPCLEARLNIEQPKGSESDNDSDSTESGDYDSNDSEYEGTTTVTGTLSGLSLTDGSSGGVRLGSTASSDIGTSVSEGSTAKHRSWRDIGKSYGIVGPTYQTSRAIRGEPEVSKVAGRGDADSGTSNNSNFAKVKATPQKIAMDAAQRVRLNEAQDEEDDVTVSSDSDDSE